MLLFKLFLSIDDGYLVSQKTLITIGWDMRSLLLGGETLQQLPIKTILWQKYSLIGSLITGDKHDKMV